MEKINTIYLNKIIKESLQEDLGKNFKDLTTDTLFNKKITCRAYIIAKENGTLAGSFLVKNILNFLDKNIKIKILKTEGSEFKKGECLIEIKGNIQAVLKGERTILNFLQRLCGIATTTRKIVSLFNNTGIKILDTRKTTPLLRQLEKYAVKIGGGTNHRFGLFDGILIKDNHLDGAYNDLISVCKKLKKKFPQKKIEVETTRLTQVKLALNSCADIIMLDNLNIKQIKKAIKIINNKKEIEVSGIKLNLLTKLKDLKINYISLGMLTHSPKSIDLSLKLKTEKTK